MCLWRGCRSKIGDRRNGWPSTSDCRTRHPALGQWRLEGFTRRSDWCDANTCQQGWSLTQVVTYIHVTVLPAPLSTRPPVSYVCTCTMWAIVYLTTYICAHRRRERSARPWTWTYPMMGLSVVIWFGLELDLICGGLTLGGNFGCLSPVFWCVVWAIISGSFKVAAGDVLCFFFCFFFSCFLWSDSGTWESSLVWSYGSTDYTCWTGCQFWWLWWDQKKKYK